MTFIHPWYLLGILLAAVPVLIHLWYRRRLRRISFSSLQFLKKTEAQRFGWLRLRELLILLMRCLLIAFLFLGLARPQLKSGLLGIGKLASVCLIVDNSYSMQYGDNFDNMKVIAQQVIDLYSPRSEFCILPLCVNQKEKPFWMSRTSALAALTKVSLCYGAGGIAEVLAQMPAKGSRYEQEYFYVGDGQSVNFFDFPVALAKENKFYWVRIPTGGNVGISNVALKDPVAIPVREYELRVIIANHSSRAWSGSIGLTAGDYYLEKECDIAADSDQEVDFVLSTGLLSGRVEIFEDSLQVDNVYYFSKSLPRALKVLVVGEGPYLVRALTAGSGSSAAFSVDNEPMISNVDLRVYDVIILHGVTTISEVDKIKLANHLNEPGAALIIILGDEVGDNLRDFLSVWCRVEDRIFPKGYVTVEPSPEEQSIFKVFGPGSALRDVQYFQYFRVKAEKGILAYFAGGDPYLVVNDNFCLITGLLDPRATNFVYKNSFVPVLLRILVSLTSKEHKEYQVGDRMQFYGMVKAPDGEFLKPGDAFSMPGFYELDNETLCVNVSPPEGDLSVLGLRRAEILNVRQVDPARHLTGSDLTNLVLMLALLALALEVGLLLLH